MVTSQETINKMLDTLKGFNQNSLYHDLDLYEHTMKAVNMAIENGYNDKVIEALYYHDVGKLICNNLGEDGHLHYFGHNEYSSQDFDYYFFTDRMKTSEHQTYPYIRNLISHHTDELTKKQCRFLIEHFGIDFLEDLHHMQICDRYAHSQYSKEKNAEKHAYQDITVKKALRLAKIDKRVKEHYKHVKSLGYEVAMIALQGSQNYSCDTELSDIDTKAIIIPSFDDIVLNKVPVSTTIILENNEHIDVKDIRIVLDLMNKSNIAYLELLFTNFKILNPMYSKALSPLFKHKNAIAMHDKKRLINCVYGLMGNKYKALKHPYPNVIYDIEKYGYCRKQYHHLLRGYEVLQRLINGESFKKTLTPIDIQKTIATKYDIYPICEVEELSNYVMEKSKEIKEEYFKNNEDNITNIDLILQTVIKRVLKIKFRDDIINTYNTKEEKIK